MKRIARIVAVALLAAACSPQVYPLYLDVRQPSSSGLNLARKSIGIVYMDGTQPADSIFDRAAASALARQLEEDYFNGREEVGLYHIPSVDSLSLDYMHSLVMDTGKDVVFVLSSQLGEKTESNGLPVASRLQVYDSMSQDKIYTFRGAALMPEPAEGEPTQAEVVGQRMSRRFLSVWKTETFRFYFYEVLDDSWEEALALVEEGKIAKAIDKWMPLTKKGSIMSRACASYNMAMAFYLLEDYEMSGRWLELADKMENLTLSDGLHKRLNNKK